MPEFDRTQGPRQDRFEKRMRLQRMSWETSASRISIRSLAFRPKFTPTKGDSIIDCNFFAGFNVAKRVKVIVTASMLR